MIRAPPFCSLPRQAEHRLYDTEGCRRSGGTVTAHPGRDERMMHTDLTAWPKARSAATLALAATLLQGCSDGPTPPPTAREFSVGAPEKIVAFRAEALGIPGGYDLDVSESGVVVGGKHGPGGETGFVWSRSTGERDIGSLGGTSYTTALGINAKGEIVGSSSPTGAINRVAFLRSPSGTFRAIGPLDTYSFARDISDAGVVVGSVNLNGSTRAFRWSAAGGLVVLPDMGGGFTVARAVNESGVVVGTSNRPETRTSEPVIWSPSGEIRRLPGLANIHGVAFDVNNTGQAVGFSTDAAGKRRAVLWEPGGDLRELGTLGGNESDAWGSTIAARSWAGAGPPRERGMPSTGPGSGE
jgi:probable HAF family extracellular repeat protein